MIGDAVVDADEAVCWEGGGEVVTALAGFCKEWGLGGQGGG